MIARRLRAIGHAAVHELLERLVERRSLLLAVLLPLVLAPRAAWTAARERLGAARPSAVAAAMKLPRPRGHAITPASAPPASPPTAAPSTPPPDHMPAESPTAAFDRACAKCLAAATTGAAALWAPAAAHAAAAWAAAAARALAHASLSRPLAGLVALASPLALRALATRPQPPTPPAAT